MCPNDHMTFRLSIKISLVRMPDDSLKLLQIEASKGGSVLEVVRPIDHRLRHCTMGE
jgi:hypothetical protein